MAPDFVVRIVNKVMACAWQLAAVGCAATDHWWLAAGCVAYSLYLAN